MKFKEYQNKLQQDAEFVEASEELKLNFDLANAILRARLKKGWSQIDLAEAVGTKQANISRIESGLANPTISLIKKLIKALGLEINIVPVGYSVVPRKNYGTMPISKEALLVTWPLSNCGPTYNTKSETMIKEGKFND